MTHWQRLLEAREISELLPAIWEERLWRALLRRIGRLAEDDDCDNWYQWRLFCYTGTRPTSATFRGDEPVIHTRLSYPSSCCTNPRHHRHPVLHTFSAALPRLDFSARAPWTTY